MASQLEEEIRNLSNEDLEEYIDTFQNRVETTRDYLYACDSYDVRMVMQGKLREYTYKLKLMLEEKNRRKTESFGPNGHPAHPTGVKITREIQDKSYKAYVKCPDFLEKIPILNNPVYRRDLEKDYLGRKSLLCKDDCLFPTCPFYDSWSIDNRVNAHAEDYDEWVVQGYKDRFK